MLFIIYVYICVSTVPSNHSRGFFLCTPTPSTTFSHPYFLPPTLPPYFRPYKLYSTAPLVFCQALYVMKFAIFPFNKLTLWGVEVYHLNTLNHTTYELLVLFYIFIIYLIFFFPFLRQQTNR